MAKKFDPAKKLKKWQQNTSGAVQAYKDGVQSYDGNPMAEAAAKGDAAKARYAQAIDNGSWAQALNSTPKSTWVNNAVNIGAGRIDSGVQKGTAKMQRYLTAAAPVYAANAAQIAAMPNTTDADRTQRMLKNLELMKAMKGIGRR